MKLGLGTVQFGLQYGINNSLGKTPIDEVENILRRARNAGIDLLDTAADYGDSEATIGSVLGQDTHFSIVTKLSQKVGAAESIKNSFERLKRTHLYGLLLHDFGQYLANPSIWDEMLALKSDGYVSKIGFSLYLPQQLELLKDRGVFFDLLQVPFSILDQRFGPYFQDLKEDEVEIHVRSVFIQGLVFRKIDELHSFFNPVREKLQTLHALSQNSGKSIQNLCLGFANSNINIDKIIIGVDSDENLAHNLEALEHKLSQGELEILDGLKEENEEMILPYKWKYK